MPTDPPTKKGRTMLLVIILLSFIPAFIYASILYWLDRYEKEPRRLLLGVFLWGAFVATTGAIIYSVLLELPLGLFLDEMSLDIAGSVVVAPLVEESLKGIAVLLVYIIFRREFDSVLDGIIYAGVTALGFAATENVLYLSSAFGEEGAAGLAALFVLRVVLGGWGHAVYTAWTGIGLAISRSSRNVALKVGAPLLGWAIAVFLHGLHNGMASLLASSEGLGGLGATLLVDWFGWAVMAGVIVWATRREQRWNATYLREELDHHLISPDQYRTACSAWAQTKARLNALSSGQYRATSRFYQLCGELAQKKHQLATFGDEGGNASIIESLRGDLAQLAPSVQ